MCDFGEKPVNGAEKAVVEKWLREVGVAAEQRKRQNTVVESEEWEGCLFLGLDKVQIMWYNK